MKVVSSLKPLCKDCYIVRKGKRIYLRCKTSPRHKRRQGFSTFIRQDALVEESVPPQRMEMKSSEMSDYLSSMHLQWSLKSSYWELMEKWRK